MPKLPRPTRRERVFESLHQLVDHLETAYKAPDAEKLDGIDSLGFLQLLTGGTRKISFGTTVLTFSGGSQSNSPTVTHGLGTTPACVLAVPSDGFTNVVGPALAVGNVGSTTFTVIGADVDATPRSATVGVYWLAIA